MAGLVETNQHSPRSRKRVGGRSTGRSGAARRAAAERATRKQLETKRRTARSNFRAGLGGARHEGRPKTYATSHIRLAEKCTSNQRMHSSSWALKCLRPPIFSIS